MQKDINKAFEEFIERSEDRQEPEVIAASEEARKAYRAMTEAQERYFCALHEIGWKEGYAAALRQIEEAEA